MIIYDRKNVGWLLRDTFCQAFLQIVKADAPGGVGGGSQELEAGTEACPIGPRPYSAKWLFLKNPICWYTY